MLSPRLAKYSLGGNEAGPEVISKVRSVAVVLQM